MEPNVHGHTMAGTLGGTLLVVFLQINKAEAFQSVVMAALGAAVSFGVSVLLKWLTKRLSRKTILKHKKHNNG